MTLTEYRKRTHPASIMAAIIWNRRRLLIESVQVMIRQRFAGSTLGLAWIVLGPALLLTMYALIYLVIFRVRPVELDAPTYVLYIFSGLVPLLAFSQGMMQGTTSLSGNRDLLLNTVFPPELVPLRETVAAVVTLSIGLGVTAVLGLILGKAAWTWLLVPVFLVLMLLLLAGVCWVLSLINLIFKDIQQVLTYVTIIMLVASPIAYTPHMLPPQLQLLIYANPLAYFVITFQSLIVLGELPALPIMAGALFFAVGSFLLGSWIFVRAKTVFFDYA
jgi:lipopolysaccharide transport system permease protein